MTRGQIKERVRRVALGLIARGRVPSETRLVAAIPGPSASMLFDLRRELVRERRLPDWSHLIRASRYGPRGDQGDWSGDDAVRARILAAKVARGEPMEGWSQSGPRVYRYPREVLG